MEAPETLGVSVGDGIKSKEAFGNPVDKQLKGLGGTLHLTQEKDIENVGRLAWQLSEQSRLPVVIVVKAISG